MGSDAWIVSSMNVSEPGILLLAPLTSSMFVQCCRPVDQTTPLDDVPTNTRLNITMRAHDSGGSKLSGVFVVLSGVRSVWGHR